MGEITARLAGPQDAEPLAKWALSNELPVGGTGPVNTSGVVCGNSPVTPIYVPYGQMYP
jgi:hypothetical protein